MNNLSFRAIATTASVLLASAALAGPTSLVLMPIADILKRYEAVAELSLAGTERNVSKGHDYGNALTIGLPDHLEVGYDSDFKGQITANVKLQLFEDAKRLPHSALSIGVMNWRGDSVDPYVVGRYDGKGYRVHCGACRTEGSGHLMIGSDFPAGAFLAGSIAYTSGKTGAAWAGLTFALPHLPGFELSVAAGRPNDPAQGLQHQLALAYAFKL